MADAKSGRFASRFDSTYDELLAESIRQWGLRAAIPMSGIETQDQADNVRVGLRRAGRHLGVAVKALWHECAGCADGGREPHYDLEFTAYPMDEARDYMAAKAQALGWPQRRKAAS